MLAQALLLAFLVVGINTQNVATTTTATETTQTVVTASVTAQTTQQLFIDGGPKEGFVGSVIAADCSTTTYGLVCTAGTFGSPDLSLSCDPSGTVTATYGPSSFGVSTVVNTGGVKATIIETCSLGGTTKAVCSASYSISANGLSTSSSTIMTHTGTDVHYFQVPITAGASKLPAQASCTKATSGSGAAVGGVVDVFKVLVVPAAALLAGVGAFA